MLRWLARLWAPGMVATFFGCSAAQHEPACNGLPRSALTLQLAADLRACNDDAACIDRAAAEHDKRREAWVRCSDEP